MKINNPLPRDKYAEHLIGLKDECAFCNLVFDFNITLYSFWTWSFSAFPYRKFHTLLITKRHILDFFELKQEELIELAKILGEIENIYKEREIVTQNSVYGDQLQISWLFRENDPTKKSVSHLHINMFPNFAGESHISPDPESHNFDPSLLVKLK